MSKKVVTLYLSAEPYERLREWCARAGRKVSHIVDEAIQNRLRELGEQPETAFTAADYEALKRAHAKLVVQVDRAEKRLRKRGVYGDLEQLALKLGINSDVSNVAEVAPKLLGEWQGAVEDVHQFISLLEAVQEKKAVERKLDLIRRGES